MIRSVVFDFDGTLVDSNEIKREGFFWIAERCPGGGHLMAEALRVVEGDRTLILREFTARARAHGALLDADHLTQEYSRKVDRDVAAANEVPGANEILDSLRALGVTTHVSSSTPRENLLRILDWRGWKDRFDSIHGMPRTKIESLRTIVLEAGLTPSEVAVVGDGVDDALSAEAVGCAFVPVGTGTFAAWRPNAETVLLSAVPDRLGLRGGAVVR